MTTDARHSVPLIAILLMAAPPDVRDADLDEITRLLRLVPDELVHVLPMKGEGLDRVREFVDAFRAWAERTQDAVMVITSGILVGWAWELLAHEARRVREKWAPEAPPAPALPDDPFATAAQILDAEYGQGLAFNEAVLSGRVRPLDFVARHPPSPRPPSRLELLRALQDALAEAERRAEDAKNRAASRAERRRQPRASIHDEDLGAEIQRLLQRLPENGAVVCLDDLWTTRAEHAGVFQAVLHLALRRLVIVRQGDERIRVHPDKDVWPLQPIYVARAIAQEAA